MDNKVMYTNSVAVSISQYDCDISFRTLVPVRDNKGQIATGTVADSIDIVMSLQETKVLLEMLKSQVDAYEKRYGLVDVSKILHRAPIKQAELQPESSQKMANLGTKNSCEV